VFRVSRNGEGVAAKQTIDEVREFVSSQPPGCYEVEETGKVSSPFGRGERPWGALIRHPDGRLVEERRPCPPESTASRAGNTDPYRKPTLIVFAGVIIFWLINLIVAIRWWVSEQNNGLGKIGQIGDSLGITNSLFTGAALAGLFYTVLLQRKEVAGQEADSRKNQYARRREARERFLTARLNAITALAHATGVRAQVAAYGRSEHETSFELKAARREAMEISQRLSVILHEVSMGFNRDWDLRVEREAIRRYIIDIFADYGRDFSELPDQLLYASEIDFRNSFPAELRSLARWTKPDHFNVSLWIDQTIIALANIKIEPKKSRQIENWLRSTLNTLSIAPDQNTWGHKPQDGRPFLP
jgi:hypothetical protein